MLLAAPAGKGALMVLMTLDAIIGAICGLRFSAGVLGPLLAIVSIEAALLSRTGKESSTLLWVIALACAVEVGYLAGALMAVWLPATRRKSFGEFFRGEDGVKSS
jgi:hypothetical protein